MRLLELKDQPQVIVVYGGGFQPFHQGHMSSYIQAKQEFPHAKFFVAASNDTKTRPIPFEAKQFLAQQAGVVDPFVQVRQPINPREITEQFNPERDILVIVRSERDPMPYTKKDGTPGYYQPFHSVAECEPLSKHGYVFVTKKHVFDVNGEEVYSGSQVRAMYAEADDAGRLGIIKQLYPRAADPKRIKQVFDQYLAPVSESSLNEFAPGNGGGDGEDDILHKYARMWWNGDEATQLKIEEILARTGWEIGEDEGGYDNGGVFVIRSGDEHGRSYQSWSAEDLTEGVAEGLEQNTNQIRQQLNAWMNQDQQFKDPTRRAGFQAKVWPYIQQNINTILSDKGADGKGSYPAAPYAAWLLVQHMDAYPQNQGKFLQQLTQSGLDPTDGKDGEGKLQFLKDRYEVNKWILQNANNKEYFINNKPLPNPTVNVRNPAMFKDAGQVATSRDEALKNAIAAGNKLLVAAVQAPPVKLTQPSYKQGVAEGIETINGGKYNVDPSKYYVWAWDGAVVLYGEYDNIQDAKINLPKIEQRAIERLGPYVKDAFELSTGKDLLQRYGKKNVAEGVDIGQEWMSDTELDQYVPQQLQQQWRELLGYDRNGNPSALWANLTGGYEPDVRDPQHRALMVKVANKWFAAKKIPNVKFFDVKDADDELEWLVQIGQQGVAEAATDDPKFQKMMGAIQKNTPDPVSGYVAVSYASEQPSKRIRGATVNGRALPATTDDPGQLIKDLKFTPDRIEQQLTVIGQKYGWDLVEPGQGQGYTEVYFDTNKEFTTHNQKQLAAMIVKTVSAINKYFSDMNRGLQATGLPAYQINVWQGMGANGNTNQIDDINQITNIAQGKTAESDAGPTIGRMILKYIPEYEAENDELGYEPEDFANAKKVASIYVTKGERAGLAAQHKLDSHVSEMIDELLSDHGGSGLRTVWDLDEGEGVAEAEGDAKGVPHVTRELLQHIIQQIGKEGAHAIIKSLEWGDGAAKELLQLITKDLKNNVSMAESVRQRLDPKCWKGKHKEGTKIKGGVGVNNCVPNESIEEGNAAQQAAIAINMKKHHKKPKNESAGNPADTLYFFDVGRGGGSFSHIDLKAMGLRQTQSGRWYWQPGRDSSDTLINASLKHLEKTLNVPAKAWKKPQ